MSYKDSRRAILIIIGIAGMLISGLALSLWRPWHIDPERPVRVGYLPIYVDLPFFVAVEEGMLKDAKVNVEPIPFQSSPDMGAALISGKIDAVASIATSSALALETRDPGKFQIFLVDAETPEAYLSSLVVPKDSEVKSVDDLRDKTIGSFPGPTAKLFGPLALKRLGLARSDYKIVELPIGSHNAALNTGRIDAVITYEPTATQAVLKYGSRKFVPGLIEANVISPWQAGIWIVSSRYARKSPAKAQAFVRAIYRAVDLIREDPQRAKGCLRNFTSIEIEIARETPNIPFTKVWEADLVTLQRHADLLTKEGVLSKAVDIPQLMMVVKATQ